jgi:protein-tyrosine phosphatase
MAAGSAFNILAVCTANLCRSPMIEWLLRARLEAAGIDWTVRSAGTEATDDGPMHQLTLRVLQSRSIVPTNWNSRALSPDLIEQADLVLTAEHYHRGRVVYLAPVSAGRTFLLRQFARYCTVSPPVSAHDSRQLGRGLLHQVARDRGDLQPISPASEAIRDPIGHPYRYFKRCAAEIEQALDQIMTAVVLGPADITPDATGGGSLRRGRIPGR